MEKNVAPSIALNNKFKLLLNGVTKYNFGMNSRQKNQISWT